MGLLLLKIELFAVYTHLVSSSSKWKRERERLVFLILVNRLDQMIFQGPSQPLKLFALLQIGSVNGRMNMTATIVYSFVVVCVFVSFLNEKIALWLA